MRTLFVLLCAGGWLAAQTTQTTYQRDLNGRRVAAAEVHKTGKGETTERMRSINGRPVPVERITERVIRDDAGGKVVEKIIQKYDATGQRAVTERVRVEETPLPGGGKIVHETTARDDGNGRFRQLERRTAETSVAVGTTTTNVTVDRPTPNGGFTTAERRVVVERTAGNSKQITETVLIPDLGGRYQEVRRSESTVQSGGGRQTTNTSIYEPDPSGRLVLSQQKVETTTKRPGGDLTETTLYTTAAPGRPRAPAERPRLVEQQILERAVNADGSVTEALAVRRASASDANRLGPAQRISETVCKGKCLPQPAGPTPVPAKN
jgi:hypothetical protein